jgi:hypothetical protein
VRTYRRSGARIAVGRSITIAEDEDVTNAVVAIGGNVRVDGRVGSDVVAIGGNVALGPTSEVRGDITVIGGSVERAPGARLLGEINDAVVGDWRSWSWPRIRGPRTEFGGWLTLGGAWMRLVLLAIVVALIALVASRPVLRVGETAMAEPWRAALVGFGAQVLFLPLLIIGSVALAVTIIGIPFLMVLVPLAVAAAFVVTLLGFAGMSVRIGGWISGRAGGGEPSIAMAAIIGAAIVLLPTLVARAVGVAPGPFGFVSFSLLIAGVLVEYAVWTVGLGAVLMTGFGRWSTVPPPVPPASPVPAGGA